MGVLHVSSGYGFYMKCECGISVLSMCHVCYGCDTCITAVSCAVGVKLVKHLYVESTTSDVSWDPIWVLIITSVILHLLLRLGRKPCCQ